MRNTPWYNDLSMIQDEAARDAVSDYLAAQWQPRMTQLEQQAAEAGNSQLPPEAHDLWNDLMTDPAGTLHQLHREVYQQQPEVAQAYENLFKTPEVEETTPAPTPNDGDDTIALEKLPPEVREMFEEHIGKKRSKEYNDQIASMIAAHEGLTEADANFLHPFIHGAAAQNGTLGDAANAYIAYRESLRNPESSNADTADVSTNADTPAVVDDAPPATLGSDGSSPTGAPPTSVEYRSWDDLGRAFDDYLTEERSKGGPAVTPVGAA